MNGHRTTSLVELLIAAKNYNISYSNLEIYFSHFMSCKKIKEVSQSTTFGNERLSPHNFDGEFMFSTPSKKIARHTTGLKV